MLASDFHLVSLFSIIVINISHLVAFGIVSPEPVDNVKTQDTYIAMYLKMQCIYNATYGK